ncbi:MAG: TatD family hydrolase [Sulfolobaceae archaeon]|nr:TatD family hydrolase [Sulfolobaceae archaeon]
MLVDCHAHIDTDDFDNDRDEVVKKCNIIIVNAGVDYNSSLKSIDLANKYTNVIPAVGLHPEFIGEKEKELPLILELISKVKIISEVGLDYYWIKDSSLRKRQIEVLQKFFEIGEKEGKPLIVHIRGGMKDLLQLISSYKLKLVVHAFEGSVKDAKRIIDYGGYISIPPIVVRDKQRQEIVKNVELSNLLTETDSPFMGAKKGERNEPCNVRLAIQKIAELKGLSEEEVENVIYNNFMRLLNLQIRS